MIQKPKYFLTISAAFMINIFLFHIVQAQEQMQQNDLNTSNHSEGLNSSLNQQSESPELQQPQNIEPLPTEPYNNNQNDNISFDEGHHQFSSSLMSEIHKTLGVRYQMGGNSPAQGLDCSGFVRWVLRHNVSLPRTAAAMARIGTTISKNHLQHGDLLFFNTRGHAYSHVGIYVGAGKFAHAASHSKRVEISQLNNQYWQKRYQIGKRVLDSINNS